MRGIFLRPDQIAEQDLSLGPLLFKSSYGRKFKLEQVMLHASQPITETINVTFISKSGSDYNLLLRTHDMSSEFDFLHRPTGECNFHPGDEIQVECTNANLIGIVSLQLKTSEF